MDSDPRFDQAPVQDSERRHGIHYPRMTSRLDSGCRNLKARLSYEGYSTTPNTLDWLYGVFAFLMWVIQV
ncbi:hypothetical protein CPB84DRAFT_1765883 [Gymnopilus junonius]|uniref:Uncharacterized protein n=1 Tax=Gymnopilus junonius TaxID=109634 RepID=A0A9P5TRF7_GYMJU|nr:hypothetical protein CPB84DRAFT_1765883 [Gymnopilus junonius]